MDQQWDDHERAKTDMMNEHVAKVGPEEPGPKETAKQWAFGGPKNESWSNTARRWVRSFETQKNKNIGR